MNRILSLCIGLLALAACKTPGKPGTHTDGPQSYSFGVQYLYAGETFYESVFVRDKTMVRKYFNDKGQCKAAVRSPCYAEEDMTVVKAELDNDEFAALQQLVEDTRFMTSDPDPDGIAEKKRFYGYVLIVDHKGAQHKVIMGSFPASADAPQSAKKIYVRLMDLSRKKGLGL